MDQVLGLVEKCVFAAAGPTPTESPHSPALPPDFPDWRLVVPLPESIIDFKAGSSRSVSLPQLVNPKA